ncbi:MAG: polysaccharide deacetylase family protein [Sphingobium sp.]
MLCITFDNFGCGADFGFGQGKLPPQMRHPVVPVSEWEKINEIAIELGNPRMLGLLNELGIPTSFCAEGYSAVLHPEELRQWTDTGHEIVLHGWKHEIWKAIPDAETEDRLLTLAMAAMREALGDKAPVGFRGPGFKLNPWSEDLLEKHGIKYVSHVEFRSQAFSDQFDDLGIEYPDEGDDVTLKRLKFSPCSDDLTDANMVRREDGGLFGKHDAITAYDMAYEAAVAHETATPDKPWVFVAHPMISGNRAWLGFERFIRRLHERFGTGAFKTIGEVALADELQSA